MLQGRLQVLLLLREQQPAHPRHACVSGGVEGVPELQLVVVQLEEALTTADVPQPVVAWQPGPRRQVHVHGPAPRDTIHTRRTPVGRTL